MNKVVSRLLVFFIGIPLVLFLVYLPYYNHIALHLAICFVSVIASLELHSILSHNLTLPPAPLLAVLSALIPVCQMLKTVFYSVNFDRFTGGIDFITAVLIFSLLVVLIYEVFSAKEFSGSNQRLSGSFFIIIYSGYLITFLQRLTVLKNEVAIITTFLLMVFMCDSIAWLFGVLLGKNNRGFIKASPNKSIAGFIGGFAGSVAAGLLAFFIWPKVFGPSPVYIIITAVLIAFLAIIGDLAESIFKRSANVKDSGTIIPGRGGVLDSIDSILLTAPFFYLFVMIFFGNAVA